MEAACKERGCILSSRLRCLSCLFACLLTWSAAANPVERLTALIDGADNASSLTAALVARGEALRVTGIPSFAPELLQSCRAGDPLKAKHLEKALMQFAEEGAPKVFKSMIGSGFVVGVVGALQFEVLASRIEMEYGLPVRFEPSQFTSARWVHGPKDKVDAFVDANKGHIAYDNDEDVVYLTRLQWDIDRIERDFPDLTLSATKEMQV